MHKIILLQLTNRLNIDTQNQSMKLFNYQSIFTLFFFSTILIYQMSGQCIFPTYEQFGSTSCINPCTSHGGSITYGENSTGKCVKVCPSGSHGHYGIEICVASCFGWYSFVDTFKNMCLNNCTYAKTSTGQNTYALSTTSVCVQSCDSTTFADDSTFTCVSSCPSYPPTYASNATRSCVSQCPLLTFADPLNMVCTDSCPNDSSGGLYGYFGNRTCLRGCPQDARFKDETNRLCLSRCYTPKVGNPASGFCEDQCPQVYPLLNTEENYCYSYWEGETNITVLVIGTTLTTIAVLSLAYLSYKYYLKKRLIRTPWKYDVVQDIQFSLP